MKKCILAVIFAIGLINVSFGVEIYTFSNNIQQRKDSTFFKLYETADSLYRVKSYASSLKYAYKLLDSVAETRNLELLYKTNYLIGEVWYSSESYEKSIDYFKQSLKLLYELQVVKVPIIGSSKESVFLENDEFLALNYKLGKIYQRLFEKLVAKENNESQRLTLIDSIRKIKYRDSLFFHYNRIIEANSSSQKTFKLKSLAYNNVAGQYIRDSLQEEAEIYTLKSIEMKKAVGDRYSIAVGYNGLSNIYYVSKEYEKSKEALFKGLNFLKELKGEREDKLRAAFYLNIAYTLYRLRDYRAYEYQKKSWNLYDQLKDVENERILVGIEADRNFEKGKQEGIFQEELKRQRTERNSWILGISLVSIIGFMGFLLNQNRLRRKNLRLALSQKETESQMQVLNANLIGQEEERKRISQELHDGVLSRLFGSRMGLGYLELNGDKETQGQYQQFLVELQSIEKEIREVSHQLSSDISLSETSFLNAVNQLLKEKSKLGNFDFQLKMDDGFSWKDLDGILEMNLFRILQEGLQNIIKHAKATDVFISFNVEKGKLLFSIKDNGVGFDVDQVKKGIGLKNIKSRVQNMKGAVEFFSKKNGGTLIEIRIPIQ